MDALPGDPGFRRQELKCGSEEFSLKASSYKEGCYAEIRSIVPSKKKRIAETVQGATPLDEGRGLYPEKALSNTQQCGDRASSGTEGVFGGL